MLAHNRVHRQKSILLPNFAETLIFRTLSFGTIQKKLRAQKKSFFVWKNHESRFKNNYFSNDNTPCCTLCTHLHWVMLHFSLRHSLTILFSFISSKLKFTKIILVCMVWVKVEKTKDCLSVIAVSQKWTTFSNCRSSSYSCFKFYDRKKKL